MSMIEVQNVTMKYKMYKEKVDSIKEFMIKKLRGQLLCEDFYALKNVSFSLNKGEVLGIVGLNGAGKSTLLKVLAHVLKPTTGKIQVKGTIAPLIELGAGFDSDLTARENIYLNASVLGYSKNYIDENLDEIIEFSELRPFMDVAIKNFSSGMVARLAFAIATCVNPEILIVDEILSVGDYIFQEKCEKRMQQLMAGGVTMVFVSHTAEQVRRICTKAIWLEKGEIVEAGTASEVVDKYLAMQS